MFTGPKAKEVKILVISDSGLNFEENRKYGLEYALKQVNGARCAPGSKWRFRMTKKRRELDRETGKPTPNLMDELKEDYDQLWLFGAAESDAWALDSDESNAIRDFMNRGHGVFATGDHQQVGRPLCGAIEKVRWMRRWFVGDGPHPGLGDSPSKYEDAQVTVWPRPLVDMTSGSQDDRDGKLIWPTLFVNEQRALVCHPILARKNGEAVRRLPDHVHEGKCADYRELGELPGAALCDFKEGGHPIAIAWGVRGKVHYNDFVSSRPDAFAVICVYDAHDLPFGHMRIVTDSTWHHWVDQNIRPLSRTSFANTKAYYLNLARWLIPKATQEQMLLEALWSVVLDPQFFPNRDDLKPGLETVLGQNAIAHWARQMGIVWAREKASVAQRALAPPAVSGARAVAARTAAAAVGIDLAELALGVLGSFLASRTHFDQCLSEADRKDVSDKFTSAVSTAIAQRMRALSELEALIGP